MFDENTMDDMAQRPGEESSHLSKLHNSLKLQLLSKQRLHNRLNQ